MRFKIRHLLVGMIGLLGLIALMSNFRVAWSVLGDSRTASSLATANLLADSVLGANALEAKERGFTAGALSNLAGVTPEQQGAIGQMRAQGDAAYAQALELAKRLAETRADHPLLVSLKALQERRSELEAARARADQALSAHQGDLTAKEWVATMTRFIESLSQVRRDGFASDNPLNEALRSNLQVKEIVFLASEFAGRERATVGVLINKGAPIDAATMATLQGYRIIVDEELMVLDALMASAPADSELGRAHAAIKARFLGRFEDLRKAVYAAGQAGQPYPVDGKTWLHESTDGIDAILAMGTAVSHQTMAAQATIRRSAIIDWFMLFAMVAASLAMVTAAVLVIRRRILVPLEVLGRSSEAIARGDLRTEVPVGHMDELGELSQRFEQMRRHLKQVIAEVRTAASAVSSGTSEISASAEEISASTRQQSQQVHQSASAVNELAASIAQVAGSAHTLSGETATSSGAIEEMSAGISSVAQHGVALARSVGETSQRIERMVMTIEQVSSHAEAALAATEQAGRNADDGCSAATQTIAGMHRITEVMSEVVGVIERLRESSAQIGSIVEVIDDIAEQTNLLALNAAIEAARAGEHGRGFAVVADEVRKLAERSARATGEIAQLIQGIQQVSQHAIDSTNRGGEAIQRGTDMVEATSQALSGISGAVNAASDRIGEVARATMEQQEASRAILAAITSMGSVADQVPAAMREQAQGSDQIVGAVGTMQTMTDQVSRATTEQETVSRGISAAMTRLEHGASETAVAIEQISVGSQLLLRQAELLESALLAFLVDQPPAGALELTSRVAMRPTGRPEVAGHR